MEREVCKLSDWIEQHKQDLIRIEKEEQNDRDVVQFKVESLDFRGNEDIFDDYLESALILKGTGSTVIDGGDLVPLPQPEYEIALSGFSVSGEETGDHAFTVRTERAAYSFSVMDKE